ncbi:MAG: 4-phosphoerythronate dehydrogenase PdxB [Planctomycetota bacterium]|jgi:erythronate-4-phosphate dehydrogenase
MLIVADENIPFAREVFSALGDVRTMSGRQMTSEAVRDAELLMVRSITKVNRALLEGSRVRFVATATIGTDHVDLAYLEQAGIAFASAPGSNARSVAEWVAAAMLTLEARGLVKLRGCTLGIVGVGNVGSRVDTVAKALGMTTLLNDPPRERAEGNAGPDKFVSLDEICARADVVTFHVPLERGGTDPTFHMIDAALLAKLRGGAALMNASRGGVHDTAALIETKRSGAIGALVLDVWEGEPRIDPEIVSLADIATPHVAGYSYDGKVAGTRMIYEAACRFLGREPEWSEELPPHEDLVVTLDAPCVRDAVKAAYDIEADDARLRQVVGLPSEGERAAGFDRLRKTYPRRREFRNWRVRLAPGAEAAGPELEALGFGVIIPT